MSEIKPALTAQEWATWFGDGARVPEMVDQCYNAVFGGRAVDGSRHAQGAVALHEQPFGFTREDVDLLGNVHSNHSGCDERTCWAVSLADRISALLPPEEK